MNEHHIRSLSLRELYNLLSEATNELLDSIDASADGVTLLKQKQKVEWLQQLIQEKKKAAE